jgi:hypothetical protein
MNSTKSKKVKIKGREFEIPLKKNNETLGEKLYREMLEYAKKVQEAKNNELITFD